MAKLIYVLITLLVSNSGFAAIYQGQVVSAVGKAHSLNGSKCTLNINSVSADAVIVTFETNSEKSSLNKLIFSVELKKSERFLFEKAFGYDYANHTIIQENFVQNTISSLLKINNSKALLTYEFSRKDTSTLFSDSQYYKFTCNALVTDE
jgi:hypothetical protein